MSIENFNFVVSLSSGDHVNIGFENELPIIGDEHSFVAILNDVIKTLCRNPNLYTDTLSLCKNGVFNCSMDDLLCSSAVNITLEKREGIITCSYTLDANGCVQLSISELFIRLLIMSLILAKINNAELKCISLITPKSNISGVFNSIITYGFLAYTLPTYLIRFRPRRKDFRIKDITPDDFIITEVETC